MSQNLKKHRVASLLPEHVEELQQSLYAVDPRLWKMLKLGNGSFWIDDGSIYSYFRLKKWDDIEVHGKDYDTLYFETCVYLQYKNYLDISIYPSNTCVTHPSHRVFFHWDERDTPRDSIRAGGEADGGAYLWYAGSQWQSACYSNFYPELVKRLQSDLLDAEYPSED